MRYVLLSVTALLLFATTPIVASSEPTPSGENFAVLQFPADAGENTGVGAAPRPAVLPLSSLPLDTLEAIVSQISRDSIESYTRKLESYPFRSSGTAANAQARNWLISKLVSFGYTPILDTCTRGSALVHNVMAYKQGVSFPHFYIMIGAHFDVIPWTPGANDDATGVAGVLEIARILKDRNTHFTIIFSLFDTEEYGMIGSGYMADRFASNRDSIAVMFNMDEIGWNAGVSDTVRLYYGPGMMAANRFSALAGSLPSVQLLSTFRGVTQTSDHYLFQSCGYTVLLALNHPLSPYHHTNRDSSTYVNFGYATRIIRGMAATALDIDEELRPALGLTFDFPDGYPDTASGISETPFTVIVTGIAGGVPAPETGRLHYALDDGEFTDIPMTVAGENTYLALLPALQCTGKNLRFYVSAQELGGTRFTYPDVATPIVIPVATGRVTAYSENFENFPVWPLIEGSWDIGSPQGLGGQYGSPDPVNGHNSARCLSYDLYGDYENNLTKQRAVSPAFDCSGLSGVHLRFWRWLGTEAVDFDSAGIAVSVDGTNFTDVWDNTQQTVGGYWMEDEVDISAIADNQPSVILQFSMGPTDGGWRYCGWNVDDLEVYGYRCEVPCCQGVRGNVNASGIVDLGDLSALVSYLTGGGYVLPCADEANVNGTGIVDLSDLSALVSYLTGGGYALPDCR